MVTTIVIIALVYLIGLLFTWKMIMDSNISDEPNNPSNLSPFWSFIWPIFWLKTIPVFRELHREEKGGKENSELNCRRNEWESKP